MNRLLDVPVTSGSSSSGSAMGRDSSANPRSGALPSPRLDPFAPDLDGAEDDCGNDGRGTHPTFTPADVPLPMMRDAERWVRRHPMASALALLSMGMAIGAVVYDMVRPRSKTEERMQRIFADLDEAIAVLRAEFEDERRG